MSLFIRKTIRYASNPRSIVRRILTEVAPLFSSVSDERFIRWRLKWSGFKYKVDFNEPKTFNDKLNWLKINYHNPLLTQLVDKYEVKKYVADLIGEEFVVPCYGVWDSYDEIDYSQLPNQFVLKATNDSSGVLICKDKSSFNYTRARRRLKKSLKTNHFWPNREWAYKDVKARIIADMYLDDHSGHELKDYKFWCFNGEPKVMYCTNKAFDTFENFYDLDFSPIYNINHGFARQKPEFEKPANFELMKDLAAKLSKGLPHVRVDFFDVDGHVYFGEYTFYDWGGTRPFESYGQDLMIGNWMVLPDPVL